MASSSISRPSAQGPDLPEILDEDDFGVLTRKLSFYFVDAITLPFTFEELRRLSTGRVLSPLIVYLSDSVHHPAIVSALLALKGYFAAHEEASDEPGVNEARGYACEFVAWKFLTNLKEREVIDFLLYELPPRPSPSPPDTESGSFVQQNGHNTSSQPTERTPLLTSVRGDYFGTDTVNDGTAATNARSTDFTSQFENLNTLEIAIVSSAKKFLKQRAVQRVINGLWRGDIVFWETLSVNSVKRPMLYNRRRADPFCRLRVPRYLKIFETIYFAIFLVLYYAVLVHRNQEKVTVLEILLYVWIAGFAYDEFGDFYDAGQVSFYASDFWWTWDISIVFVGVAFFTLRIVGLRTGSKDITDVAYDVLGLEALFLVPRIFSLLSLNPYFGTLIPCLKEMTKDFVKFLSLVLILYLGFLTTFVLLGRDKFKPQEMSWILIKVFFGSSYLGFDIANEISPFFGPPVMLVFVALTNILLITSLISLLSNSLSKVLDHARDEYLFIYSVYVLEASSSNRLTYFFPPLNLIPLFLRPFRLVLPSERLRSTRIVLLKGTHLPFIGVIWVLEQFADARKRSSGMGSIHGPETTTAMRRPLKVFANSPGPLATATVAAEFQASSERSSALPGGTYQASRPRNVAAVHESESQLTSLVLKLTAQVDELTAMVSQLQEQREGEASEAA